MEQINELIKEIEDSNFAPIAEENRVEANVASQQLGGRTIPRDADAGASVLYVTLLMLRNAVKNGAL